MLFRSQVLRALLFQFLDCRTGRLDPSLDTLARTTGHCRATIVTALARLRRAGFISWVQRVVLVKVGDELRPQQVTNAYTIGTGLVSAGLMPSGWKAAYGSKFWSETTEPYFLRETQATPDDTGLRSALERLARAAGWSQQKLADAGF